MTLVWAVAAAALWACAWPPIGVGVAAPISIGVLGWLGVRARSTRGAILITYVAHVAMGLWLYRWVAPISMFGLPVMALYLSIYPLLTVWLLRRVHTRSALPMTVALPIVYTGVEFIRGAIGANGFPWFLMAHPFVDLPAMVQTADMFGTYFVGTLIALAAGVGLDCALARRVCLVPVATLVVVHAANLGYGFWRLGQPLDEETGPTIMAVQTNLPQSNKMKWTFEQQAIDFNDWVRLTVDGFESADAPIDLVVWPETTLPGFGLERETIQYTIDNQFQPADYFSKTVELLYTHLQTPLLLGSPSFENLHADEEQRWQFDRRFNSAYLVDGNPPYERYDKVFLTPFGEVMPYFSAWPWLEEQLLAIGAAGMTFDLDAADEIRRFRLAGTWNVATPICFEDTVPHVCRRMVHESGTKVTDAIVNLSNDGWFGDHDYGRALHVAAARFRCIENRVPMIRSANTGYSVAVDSRGILLGRIGSGRYGEGRTDGTLIATLPTDARTTLYGRIGDAWGWAMLAATAVLAIVRRGRPAATEEST